MNWRPDADLHARRLSVWRVCGQRRARACRQTSSRSSGATWLGWNWSLSRSARRHVPSGSSGHQIQTLEASKALWGQKYWFRSLLPIAIGRTYSSTMTMILRTELIILTDVAEPWMCFRLWPVSPRPDRKSAWARPPRGGAGLSLGDYGAAFVDGHLEHPTNRRRVRKLKLLERDQDICLAFYAQEKSRFSLDDRRSNLAGVAVYRVHIGGPSHKDLGQSRPSKSQYPCKAARKRPQRGYRAAVRARLRRSRRSSHSTISPSMQWTVEQAEVERRIAAGEIVSAAEPWRPAQLKEQRSTARRRGKRVGV